MTKSSKTHSKGVVLLTTEDGTVTKVLHDPFDLFPNNSGSDLSFLDCLNRHSVEDGYRLVESVNDNGVAFDWELHIEKQHYTSFFKFSGVKKDKGILLIGSPDSRHIEQSSNGFMELNNGQLNKLRLSTEKQRENISKENEWTLYDDMSQLNNELTNTQRELAKKTAELERINELKNQMMGMAAHDLRNPLSLIQNYAFFLMDDHQERAIFTDDQYQWIKEIKGSSEYMVQIIEDMLDISSFESGSINLKKKTYNLVELVEEAVALSRSSANKKNIIITTHLPDSSVNKVIDAHKIRQVVDNLLSNAIKYSNPDTEVEVGINHTNEAEGVTVFIKDHGQGIPENEIGKLFEPFAQISVKATAGEKSTGLGLAIVQKIVEAHGGEIEVDSKVGVGSTFIIKIP